MKFEVMVMNLDHFCKNNQSTSSIDRFTILLQILLKEKVKKYVVDGAWTHDLLVGRWALYQLSYEGLMYTGHFFLLFVWRAAAWSLKTSKSRLVNVL